MTKQELKAAVQALGLTYAQTAEKLGITESWLKKMLDEKSEKQVSRRIADKIKLMIAEIPRLPAWERCPRCGYRMHIRQSRRGSGVAVIHRCPEVAGVIVKTTIEPMGVTADQAKAALGRRPGKAKGGC